MTTAEPTMLLLLLLFLAGVTLVVLLAIKATRGAAVWLIAVAVLVLLVLGPYAYTARHNSIIQTRQQAARQTQTRPRNFRFNITWKRPSKTTPIAPSSAAELDSEEGFGDLDTIANGEASPARPAWVESEPNYEGDAHKIAVLAGPFKTKDECQRALRDEIKAALVDYFDWYMAQDQSVPNVRIQPIDADLQLLDPEIWPEPHQHPSFGTMYRLHALLTIDQKYRNHLQDRARETLVGERLKKTGFASAGALALLTTLFGFLKLKQAARTRRGSGRKYAQVGVCVFAVAAAELMARWGSWL